MYQRSIIEKLLQWKNSSGRKPLVLRGARQVGKTSVVHLFAQHFEQYIYLNLETSEDKEIFSKFSSIHDLLKAIFFLKEKDLHKPNTLIFIDEIQEVPEALAILRYFYEKYPQYHVIAAGSLLESLFCNHISFPVGRVEYMVVRPFSFREFLEAMGEKAALEQYLSAKVEIYAHDKLLKLFHDYALIGGMPEVIKTYAETKNLTSLKTIYDSLILSYIDDVEKYASTVSQVQCMRHVIRSSFYEAATRIKFQGFGQSSYSSREMGEALRTVEKAFIINLIYPTTQVSQPFLPDVKKSPRLQVLDTGMLNHFAGIQTQVLGARDLNNLYQGRVAEHIAGQEMLAAQEDLIHPLRFWVREKKESTAEIDYLFPYRGRMIPVEVKSGATGSLRSLHQYMEMSDETIAIRLYAGNASINQIQTPNGKTFELHSLPYYLAGNLMEYCNRTLTFIQSF